MTFAVENEVTGTNWLLLDDGGWSTWQQDSNRPRPWFSPGMTASRTISN